MIKPVEMIGWGSSLILLATLLRQVYTQWRTRATTGLSKWLFAGQCAASVGYIWYSAALQNWVYVSSNIAILGTALLGEWLYFRNRRLEGARGESGGRTTPTITNAAKSIASAITPTGS